MTRIRYTPASRAELTAILDYIRRQSPSGSRTVARRIRQLIGLLATHPDAGPMTEDPAIRRIIASPYPYVIFYQHKGKTVLIHAVRHAARDPKQMPGTTVGP